MWLCAIVLATWEKYNELRDPTYNHFVDTGNYQVSMQIPLKSKDFPCGNFHQNIKIDCIFRGFKHFSTYPVQCIFCI